jgi:hypothetical protein
MSKHTIRVVGRSRHDLAHPSPGPFPRGVRSSLVAGVRGSRIPGASGRLRRRPAVDHGTDPVDVDLDARFRVVQGSGGRAGVGPGSGARCPCPGIALSGRGGPCSRRGGNQLANGLRTAVHRRGRLHRHHRITGPRARQLGSARPDLRGPRWDCPADRRHHRDGVRTGRQGRAAGDAHRGNDPRHQPDLQPPCAGNDLDLPAGATFGQSIPAVRSRDAIAFGQQARLVHWPTARRRASAPMSDWSTWWHGPPSSPSTSMRPTEPFSGP